MKKINWPVVLAGGLVGLAAVVLTAKLCVSQILTELSQKIRRPAIESIRLACIIGMLGTHCPHKEGGTVAPGGAAEKR